jgi:hypothetical protein
VVAGEQAVAKNEHVQIENVSDLHGAAGVRVEPSPLVCESYACCGPRAASPVRTRDGEAIAMPRATIKSRNAPGPK